MKALRNQTAETAARYLENLEERGVAPSPEALTGLKELYQRLPELPMEAGRVLEALDRIGSPATMSMAGPSVLRIRDRWLPASSAGDELAGRCLGSVPRSVAASPVGTVLEEVSLGWLLDVLKLPVECGRAFVTGRYRGQFRRTRSGAG